LLFGTAGREEQDGLDLYSGLSLSGCLIWQVF